MHNTIVKGWLPVKNDKKGKRKRNNLIKNGEKIESFWIQTVSMHVAGPKCKGGGVVKMLNVYPLEHWNLLEVPYVCLV